MDSPSINYPAWVNWIAQDENDNWWSFSVEPLEHDHGWYKNKVEKYIIRKKGNRTASGLTASKK